MRIIFLLIILVIFIYVIRCLRVAGDTQRYAVFRLGKFLGLKGPGVFFVIPKTEQAYPLVLGQKGELMNDTTARFGNIDVPVIRDLDSSVGCIVQITDFNEDNVMIMKSPDQSRFVYCEKCGHKMKVS